MKVQATKYDNGLFEVINDDGSILLGNVSNERAWKFVDRLNDEPNSKQESRAAYSFNQFMKSE